jgi:hypothetical protein
MTTSERKTVQAMLLIDGEMLDPFAIQGETIYAS